MKLNNLLNDEVCDVILISKNNLLNTEDVVKLTINEEILQKIKKALLLKKEDSSLLDYKCALNRPLKIEGLAGDLNQEYSHNILLYNHFYRQDNEIAIASEYENCTWNPYKTHNENNSLCVRFYDYKGETAVSAIIFSSSESMFFYVQRSRSFFEEKPPSTHKTLSNLSEDLIVRFGGL